MGSKLHHPIPIKIYLRDWNDIYAHTVASTSSSLHQFLLATATVLLTELKHAEFFENALAIISGMSIWGFRCLHNEEIDSSRGVRINSGKWNNVRCDSSLL